LKGEEMNPTSFEGWLEVRMPGVPSEFLPHLLGHGRTEAPTAEGLEALGEEAIARALERPGRDREAAFALLTGDAFLTYACEASAQDEGDVGVALIGIIKRLGSIFP
jgi:hypothetical protein